MIKPSNDLFCPLNSPKPTYSNIDMKLTRATKQQILPCVKLEPENIWWYSSLIEKKNPQMIKLWSNMSIFTQLI